MWFSVLSAFLIFFSFLSISTPLWLQISPLCRLIPELCLWSPPSMSSSPVNLSPVARTHRPVLSWTVNIYSLMSHRASQTMRLLTWAPSSPAPTLVHGPASSLSPSLSPLQGHPETAQKSPPHLSRAIGVQKYKGLLHEDTLLCIHPVILLHVPVWLCVNIFERKVWV